MGILRTFFITRLFAMISMALSRFISRMAVASSLVIFEKPPEMAMQGVKIYSLGLTVVVTGVAFFGAAPGMTHILPVGCLIACALKTGIIDKGLGKVYRASLAMTLFLTFYELVNIAIEASEPFDNK